MLSPKLKLISLVVFACAILVFFITTIYLFAFKETSTSYSLVQSWKEYHSLEDWNLAMHAIADLDGDGKKDMITFTNCAFLSSVPSEKIPEDKHCKEPGMSALVFPDNSISVGQKLSSNPFNYQWLRKSYLVKTKNNMWKYYDMNGLQVRTYELRENSLFVEVEPTILDRFDIFTYQLSHLGVVLLLIVLPH